MLILTKFHSCRHYPCRPNHTKLICLRLSGSNHYIVYPTDRQTCHCSVCVLTGRKSKFWASLKKRQFKARIAATQTTDSTEELSKQACFVEDVSGGVYILGTGIDVLVGCYSVVWNLTS